MGGDGLRVVGRRRGLLGLNREVAWMPDADLQNQVSMLTIDVSVLRLALAHFIAAEARRSDDPEDALRRLADDIHASLDTASSPPPAIAAMIEQSRARIDDLMLAARLRLAGEKYGR